METIETLDIDTEKFHSLTKSVFEEDKNKSDWLVQCACINLKLNMYDYSDFLEELKTLEDDLKEYLLFNDRKEDIISKSLRVLVDTLREKRESNETTAKNMDQLNQIMINTKKEEEAGLNDAGNCFLLNQLNQFDIKTEMLEESKEEAFLNERNEINLQTFVRECNLKNKFKISCALVDGKGNFVIYDKLARDSVYECKKINAVSLFDLMIPLSVRLLNKKFGECVFKKSNETKICSYTIYSENAKKKYRKSINKKALEECRATEMKYSAEESSGIDIFYKYLKCLTSRITKVRLSINKAVLEKLPSKGSLIYNKSNPLVEEILNSDQDKEFTLILLETRNAKHIQKFNYEYMRTDRKIQTLEEKIKKKKMKLDGDFNKGMLRKNIEHENSENELLIKDFMND